MAEILIIDDDPQVSSTLGTLFSRLGHNYCEAATLAEGREVACRQAFDLIFLDVRLPDGNGLELISEFGDSPGQPEIIILTGAGDPDGAELAITSGAWDYVEKGSSIKEIILPMERALQFRREKQRSRRQKILQFDNIIGSSAPLQRCLDLLALAATGQSNVLIHGETGTGKELIARAIHASSERAEKNFVVVDCATLPPSLIESVLFGYRKGAFTGADHNHDGLIAEAAGGTLFLDEIGELPLKTQKVFLRVLQERTFRPLGDTAEQHSDFRLIAATNRNLEELAQSGDFRRDLWYRLKTLEIEVPPLRRRSEDIPELVKFHLQRLTHRLDDSKRPVAEFIDALMLYDWPGNIRELVNTLEAAILNAGRGEVLLPQHLPPQIRIFSLRRSLERSEVSKMEEQAKLTPKPGPGRLPPPKITSTATKLPTIKEYRRQADAHYLDQLLRTTGGNISTAVRISGLSRSTFYSLLQKHGKKGLSRE